VEVTIPLEQLPSSIVDREEQFPVQELVSKPAVEGQSIGGRENRPWFVCEVARAHGTDVAAVMKTRHHIVSVGAKPSGRGANR
jgi:hypothetical protein